jgi:Na+/alanine symporter
MTSEKPKKRFSDRIKSIGEHAVALFEHTVALLLILGSIWIIRKALEYLLGKDPMLFKVVPIEFITDFADLLALIKYLWNLIKEFGGRR